MKRGSRLTKFEQERLDSWKTVYQPWCLDSDKKTLMKNFVDEHHFRLTYSLWDAILLNHSFNYSGKPEEECQTEEAEEPKVPQEKAITNVLEVMLKSGPLMMSRGAPPNMKKKRAMSLPPKPPPPKKAAAALENMLKTRAPPPPAKKAATALQKMLAARLK